MSDNWGFYLIIGIFLLIPIISILSEIRAERASKKGWERFASEMGLQYTRGRSKHSLIGKSTYNLSGRYRGRNVEIRLVWKRTGRTSSPKTIFNVGFENLDGIWIRLTEGGAISEKLSDFATWINEKQDWKTEHYIRIGVPEFDKNYLVWGSSESDVKKILDSDIRGKIMNTKDFQIYIDRKKPDVICKNEWGFVKDATRLHSVLDIMIDIAERIEKMERRLGKE